MNGYTILGIVIGVIILAAAIKTKRPVSALGTSALQGVCALAAVNVASVFSGVTLGVTGFSLTVCGLLGLPGVIGLLVMQSMCVMVI